MLILPFLGTGVKKNGAERLHQQRQKLSDLFPVHAVIKQYLEHYVTQTVQVDESISRFNLISG